VASTEVERHTGVDTAEVPSADWGWSGDYARVWHIGGILVGIFLLCMIRGNHVGRTEDWFLVVFAAGVFFVVFRDIWRRRKGIIR
jgi:hypothetical protein